MIGISPIYYMDIYILLFFIPVLFIYLANSRSDGNRYLLRVQSYWPIAILIIFLIFFIGFRPQSPVFVDMFLYERRYSMISTNSESHFSWNSEWLWMWIIIACKKLGLSVSSWFAIISLGYFGSVFWTCKKLIYENATVPVLFFLSSYTFFNYGVNTIRNGVACTIVMLAFALFLDNKRNWWIALLIAFAAFGIHRTVLLPFVAFLASVFVIKNPKISVYLWVASIFVSLLSGDRFSQLIAGLEIDDRFDKYLNNRSYDSMFSHTGFRWDFVLYSSVPVAVIYYAVFVKKIKDKTFGAIAGTYLLSNALWIICIRASNSDRFAHLSWFLFPLVLAYAFVRLPMMKNQDRAMAWALLLNAMFTITMNMLGK